MVYRAPRPSISLSESLSPSRRRWPRPSCGRPYASRLVEDLLGRLVRASSTLSSLWAAIADRSHASRSVLFCTLPGPLLRTPLRSPSRSAPSGNIVSPSTPDTPPQRIYGTRNSPRRQHRVCARSSQSVLVSPRPHPCSATMVCTSTPRHAVPPHSVARQHTCPRHVAILPSLDGRTQRMQPMRIGIWF